MKKRVQKGEYLDLLLRSKKTVFSTKDVALLWGDTNISAVLVRLYSYAKKGKLLRLRRGLYAKDKNYNKYELANSILRPSYVSFETVLGAAGITFQYYARIFVASYVTREITCDKQVYDFKKINTKILVNPSGVDRSEEYSIATKERAFLDVIYRYKDYHFDNLDPLDWEKVFEILPIYDSRRMEKKVKRYHKQFKSELI